MPMKTPKDLLLPAFVLLAPHAIACDPPLASAAIVGELAQPALVCPGEMLSFDGSASTGVGGPITAYLWDFGDGASDTGMVVQHAFLEPGAYHVRLSVQQDTCVSLAPSALMVWVSPAPDFSVLASTVPSTICAGDTIYLNGETGTNAGHWSSLPSGADHWNDPPMFPDSDPAGFTNALTFTGFSPGEAVDSIDDITGICASLEHSYMGDLVIQITCPNGQSMLMHQQGGGGTYIGGANDGDEFNPIPGECWSYCWTPDTAWGTFAQNSEFGATPHVMLGGTPPRSALIPGDYSSVQPFTNLIGCPLNGPWTLSIYDLWAADNGYICDWWIDFAPGLSDSVIHFTPTIGFTNPDSAYWSGDGFVPNSENSSEGMAVPADLGLHAYSYTVTNNFGCTYDTTLTVQVAIIPVPVLISGDSTTCGNAHVLLSAPEGYDSYRWQYSYQTSQQLLVGPGTFTVTVTLGSCEAESEPFVVLATAPAETPAITQQDLLLVSSEALAYQWFLDDVPIDGAVDQTLEPVANGLYTVEITDANGCQAVSDSYPFTTLGIEATVGGGLLLHPQPARDVLLLSGARTGSAYRLFDLGGQLLLKGSVTGSPQQIRVEGLAPGFDVLELRQDQQGGRWPVIVE